MSRIQTLRHSPSLIVAGRLAGVGATLISAPITARALGPDGRGESAAAIAAFFIVPVILGLGVPLEVRRQHAIGLGHEALRAGRILAACSTLPALALAALLHQTLFGGFGEAAGLVAAVGVAAAPLAFSWACDLGVVLADQRFGAVFVLQIAHPLVYVCSIVILWLTGTATVATVLAANIGGTAVTFGAGLVLTRRVHTSSASPWPLLRRGIKFAGAGIAEVASNKLDQALALPILGASAAGIYSIGVTIASTPLALGHALSAATFREMARAEGAERTVLQGQAVRAALALGVIVAPIMVLLSWPLVPILFGEEFEPAFVVIVICAPGTVAMLVAFVASICLAADSRGLRMTTSQLIGLVVSTSLLVILGGPLDSAGAAVASSVGYTVLLICLVISLRLPLREFLPRPADGVRSIKLLLNARTS